VIKNIKYYLRLYPKGLVISITFRIIVLAISISLFSCNILGPPSLDIRPVHLYDPGKTQLHPDYTVYHSGENESTVFFRILCRELLFNRANPDDINRAKIKIDYKLYSSFTDQKIEIDSSRIYLIDREVNRDEFIGSFKLPVEEGISYLLELTLIDQMRESRKVDYVFVDRFSQKSQQNFLVLTYPGQDVGFEKYFYPDETFRIISNSISQGRMQVSFYEPVSILPPPPFMVDEIPSRSVSPDSLWEVDYNQQSLFQLEERGVYQFFPPNDPPNALYLVNFGDHFPRIETPEDMAPPLQYITTSEEYKGIISQEDLKKSIDQFWVKTGKDFNNARELIKIYYNRVLFANLFYSTDREGWKTDRGMIYLLMGPPEMVKKTETREEWIYQSRESRGSYRLIFTLESDPVKVYDFVLHRSEDHRTVWNDAVQTWRNGRIFSL